MEYSEVILEMLGRIKKLEDRVSILENEKKGEMKLVNNCDSRAYKNLTQQTRNYIHQKKSEAKLKGLTEIVLVCNDIQKDLHVKNRPRSICVAMYDCLCEGDEVLSSPPSGYSTTLKIKYYL